MGKSAKDSKDQKGSDSHTVASKTHNSIHKRKVSLHFKTCTVPVPLSFTQKKPNTVGVTGKESSVKKKYEMMVHYVQVVGPSAAQAGKEPQLRKKRILLGTKGKMDSFDFIGKGPDMALFAEQFENFNKHKAKNLSFNTDSFAQEDYMKEGSFLGSKFWTQNLLYNSINPMENLFQTINRLRSDEAVGSLVITDSDLPNKISQTFLKQYFDDGQRPTKKIAGEKVSQAEVMMPQGDSVSNN